MEIIKSIFDQISVFDFIYLTITIFYLFRCSIKGFILSLLSAAKWLLAYVLTLIMFPKIKPYVKDVLDNEYILDILLGISSRGVGSTINESGNQIVQDDFQLICFDMVSEPSTPGAFMLSEGKNVTRRDLDKHFNSSDKIDRIFNEILMWENE